MAQPYIFVCRVLVASAPSWRALLLNLGLLIPWLLSGAAIAAAYDTGAATKKMAGAQAVEILRLTPTGEDVPPGQQLVLQFNQDMVPVGEMRRDAATLPVDITPALNCEWRWLNSSALACQLDQKSAMTPATHYRVHVRPGLTSTAGAKMSASWQGEFITQRPVVESTSLVFWLTPQKPILRLRFSSPVTRTSVAKALSLRSGTVSSTTPFAIHADDTRRQFPEWAEYLQLDENQPEKVNDEKMGSGADEARRIWLLVPEQELPADAAIQLSVSPGLVTPRGAEAGVEEGVLLAFDSFPAFTFLGIRCMPSGGGNNYEAYDVADLRAAVSPKCNPLSSVQLRFSSPVLSSQIKANAAFTPRLDGGRTDYDPWANTEDYTQRIGAYERGREYAVWLPELLKAAQNYSVTLDAGLQDEFGRHLSAPLSVHFATAHREPRLVVDYRDVVLEKGVDSQAVAYATNLDKVSYRGMRIDARGKASPVGHEQPMANLQDISYKFVLMVREILQGASGVSWFCVNGTPAVTEAYYQPPCVLAQVTPFAVHAKLGHFSSLAWVTDLATGEPVVGAKVAVVLARRNALGALPPLGPQARSATMTSDAQGLVELPGVSTIDPQLQFLRWGSDDDEPRLFVRVVRGDDIALLPLDYAYDAQPGGGIWSDLQRVGSHAQAWGFSAQGIYRAGETVDAKLWLRDQSNRRWKKPAVRAGYSLRVTDPVGTEVYSANGITLDAFGAHAFSFPLAAQAVAGWYDVQLKPAKGEGWTALKFLVSDFTPAPFRTETLVAGDVFGPGDTISVTTRTSWYSGGAFANANVRVTAQLEGLRYSPGTAATRGYTFGSWETTRTGQQQIGEQNGQVNAAGEYQSQFQAKDDGIYYGRLMIESAVMDDRGKNVSARSSAVYVSRDRFVGIKPRRWLYNAGEDGIFDFIVADPRGKLVGETSIDVTLEKRVIHSARVQGPGNAFLLRNTGDWEAAATCQAVSSQTGSVPCTLKPPTPGSYRLVAKIKDSKGRDYSTVDELWVVGPGWVNWASDNDTGLEIVAENDSVQAGEIARYLVKNPYPGARALITVERYGVLERRVQIFPNSTAVIEIPVTADMAPGFYLSVVVESPRVQKPIEGEVDLGKPAFRMGYVATKVKSTQKRIALTLTPTRMEYRPRDDVSAKLHATLPATAKGKPVSIAVLAIDESVLALNAAGASYYDPEEGFNRLDALDVGNWNLITRLVGRQKIEKKGANPGGDGGSASFSSLRDQFRYIALWQGDVTLDANGDALIRFKAPDNLTGWRIVAIALTADDAFGLGQSTVRVNRPTEIRPAMPNQVTEGDRFTARFTVMNRSKTTRTLHVHIEGSGATLKPLDTTLALAPYEQKVVELPVITTTAGDVRFKASAGDAADRDALAHTVPVKPRRVKEVAANYGTTVEPLAGDEIAIPKDIYPDASVLSVTLAPTVLGNLDGAFRYVTQYPYLCWEQRLDKALMVASSKTLKPWLKPSDVPANPDAQVRDLLNSAKGFQAPNGGMSYWQANDAYVSPYLSAYTALAFRWLANSGYAVPKEVESRLQDYLRTMIRSNVMPSLYDAGMSSTVRAVALAALADAHSINKDEVLRYASHLPRMALLGKSHYLQALIASGAPPAEIQRTVEAMLAMGNQSGGKFQLTETLHDNYSELLATPLRDNCAALSGLLRAASTPGVSEKVADVPFKLVRMITQARGNRDHFENTQENVFCTNALVAYARAYEREPPAMTVNVSVGNVALGTATFASVQDPAKLLRRPLTAKDPGTRSNVQFKRNGTGRLYYSTRLEFAPKESAARSANNGIEITREYSRKRGDQWELLKGGETLARGDVIRVDLFVKTPAARHYVVVDDPVPGLWEPVNTDLATESTVDDANARWTGDAHSYWYSNRDNWQTFGRWGYSFYHREIKHDAVRFYADLLPAGNYHLAYSAQVIATGQFTAQPTFAGEMYDIDVFGRGLPAQLNADAAK